MLLTQAKAFFSLLLGESGASTDSPEPRWMRGAQDSSRLLNLPFELIWRIFFDYQYASRDDCALRLVCSALNGLVKHRVARRLRLPNNNVEREKWETLTSRGSVFSTVTDALYLEGFERDKRKRSGCVRYPFNEALHNAQTKYLCHSIARLKQVKTVHWKIYDRLKMNHDILKCLKQLPRLENIYFSADQSPKAMHLQYPWIAPGMSNLKSVSLNLYSQDHLPGNDKFGINALSNDIHKLLASCPTLEFLDLTGPSHVSIDLSSIIRDIPTKQEFKASVTSLRLRDMSLKPSPGMLLYLSQLTSLDIANNTGLNNELWEGLHKSHIKLRVVKVSHIPHSLLAYLSSYTGLREFHGIIWHRPRRNFDVPPKRVDTEARDRLFQSVLPLHKDSLEAICVSAPLYCNNEKDAQFWCVTEKQIAQLQQFSGLRTLEVAYAFNCDEDGVPVVELGSMPVDDVLVGIVCHPFSETLRTIQLNPVITGGHLGRFGLPLDPPMQSRTYDRHIASIAKLRFDPCALTATRAGQSLGLILYGRKWPLVYDPGQTDSQGAWRFDILEAGNPYWADLKEKLLDFHTLYIPLEEDP